MVVTDIVKYDPPYKACPACNSSQIGLLLKDFRENHIFSCKQCSVQFMNPIFSDEYLQHYYAEYYEGEIPEANYMKAHQRDNEVKFQFIERYTQPPGKALDFGCGNGNFAEYAKMRGWDVIGYDVDGDAMNKVSERLGIDVESGPFESIDWKESKFDLIHAYHVIEHLKYPMRDLKKLHNLLADNGFLYIAVPNINALSVRVKFRLEKLGLRRKNIGKYYDSEHHIFYYSPKSLTAMLDKCGFEVVFSMNATKVTAEHSKIAQFFARDLPNALYSNGAFFIIATKKKSA